ncbi:MAG TPA: L,D-transpeptidase family protein [Nocardioides sp.]|nr:L,D-transpeptidase family protein [Nocardioides sp.]
MNRSASLVAALVAGTVLAVLLGLVPAAAAPGEDAVAKAQRRLNALGCQAGPADGDLGAWTRSAVLRFQSRQRIATTGRLDERTRRKLYAEGRWAAERCDRRPVPGHSGQGRRIVISQRQNWVWLVGPSGGVVAQGGMVDNPRVLRRGAHATGSYCGRAARIKLNQSTSGTVWLDNFVRFAPCGIGFHRIPRSKSNGKQIHADWVLGTNMATSHGCIRLSKAMSRKVWDFTARRTPVRVV